MFQRGNIENITIGGGTRKFYLQVHIKCLKFALDGGELGGSGENTLTSDYINVYLHGGNIVC